MSSKGLLAKMYEMFPDSPWLIPTRLVESDYKAALLANCSTKSDFVLKPCLSREGYGVHIIKGNQHIVAKDCEHNSKQHVIQDFVPSYKSEQGTIMAGVWVVGGVSCGLGLRLDGDITGDLARFIPHFFVSH
jgi:glutathionylspermidine synthase